MVTEKQLYFLRKKALFTRQAGGDLSALCLDPEWLMPSLALRSIGEIAADLRLSPDPRLLRLARTLEQSAHLLSGTMPKPHRIDTILGWMSSDQTLCRLVDRCARTLARATLRLVWAVQPTGAARGHTLRRHTSRLVACGFSQNDRYLVTLDDSFVTLLWDVASGELVKALAERAGDPSIVTPVSQLWPTPLAGGSDQVAVPAADGGVTVWSVTDKIIWQYALDPPDGDASFHPVPIDDEVFMVRAGRAVQVHEWRTGAVRLVLEAGTAALGVRDHLLACETEQSLDVWDLSRGILAGSIANRGDDLMALAIDRDLLLAADLDGKARLWNWRTGRRIGTYRGVADVPQVDTDAGRLRWLRRPGELVVTPIDKGFRLPGRYPMPSASAEDEDYDWAISVRLSARHLATVATHRRTVRDSDVQTRHRVDVFDVADGRSVADGWGDGAAVQAVRGADTDQLLVVTDQGTTETWDLPANQVRHARTATDGEPLGTAVAISHDRRIVAVSAGRDVQLVWPEDAETTATAAYPLIGRPIRLLADPAGQWLATLTDQLLLDIWDPTSGRHMHRCSGPAPLEFHSAPEFHVFSPDGRWIATNDWDGSVLLWDPITGRQLAGLGPQDAFLVFATNGSSGPVILRRYFAGDVAAWDVRRRRRIATLPQARQYAGDNSGHRLACLDGAGVATIWDLTTGRLERSFTDIAGMVADSHGDRLILWDSHEVHPVAWSGAPSTIIASGTADVVSVLADPVGRGPIVARADGSVSVPGHQSLRTGLPAAADLSWRLSPCGRMLAAAHPTAGQVELIDLTATKDHASATLDGGISDWALQRNRSVALAGRFGVRCLALRPNTNEETS